MKKYKDQIPLVLISMALVIQSYTGSTSLLYLLSIGAVIVTTLSYYVATKVFLGLEMQIDLGVKIEFDFPFVLASLASQMGLLYLLFSAEYYVVMGYILPAFLINVGTIIFGLLLYLEVLALEKGDDISDEDD
jgi:hypothetical protein